MYNHAFEGINFMIPDSNGSQHESGIQEWPQTNFTFLNQKSGNYWNEES